VRGGAGLGGGGRGLNVVRGHGGRGSVRVYIKDRGQGIGETDMATTWSIQTAVSLCNRHTSSIYREARTTYIQGHGPHTTGGTLLLYGGHAQVIMGALT
jgi:hypothetical protein